MKCEQCGFEMEELVPGYLDSIVAGASVQWCPHCGCAFHDDGHGSSFGWHYPERVKTVDSKEDAK